MHQERGKMFEVVRRLNGASESQTFLMKRGSELRIRKLATSCGQKKLNSQLKWYAEYKGLLKLPQILEVRSLDHSLYYDMEFIPESYNLFELSLRKPVCAERALKKTLNFLGEEFHRSGPKEDRAEDRDHYIRSKLVDKLFFIEGKIRPFSGMLGDPQIFVNGNGYLNIRPAIDEILSDSKFMKKLAYAAWSPLHGDLTLENLIYSSGQIYFIDPNDENYLSTELVDLAKLMQSLDSKYENTQYVSNIAITQNHIHFDLPEWSIGDRLLEIFWKYFDTRFDPEYVRVLRFHQAIHLARLLPYQLKLKSNRFWPLYAELIRVLNLVCKDAR